MHYKTISVSDLYPFFFSIADQITHFFFPENTFLRIEWAAVGKTKVFINRIVYANTQCVLIYVI